MDLEKLEYLLSKNKNYDIENPSDQLRTDAIDFLEEARITGRIQNFYGLRLGKNLHRNRTF